MYRCSLAKMLRLLSFMVFLPLALAQTELPKFEVAAIKHSPPLNGTPRRAAWGPIYVTLPNISVRALLINAYQLRVDQVSGPAWMNEGFFDIEAKAPDGTPPDQIRPMVAALVTERFKLVAHWEDKTVNGYGLVVAKEGFKAKTTDKRGSSFSMGGPTQNVQGSFTMKQLVNFLSSDLGLNTPVEDLTGIDGTYDIDLKFASMKAGSADPNSPEGSVFSVLPEKLGLRLEPRKVTLKVLVVESGSKTPTEN